MSAQELYPCIMSLEKEKRMNMFLLLHLRLQSEMHPFFEGLHDDPKSIDPFIQYILKYTKVILGTKFTT